MFVLPAYVLETLSVLNFRVKNSYSFPSREIKQISQTVRPVPADMGDFVVYSYSNLFFTEGH